MKDAEAGPWYARLAASILTTQGLATLLALVLVGALLWFIYQFLDDARAFETTVTVQLAVVNERLDQISEDLERIERIMVGAYSANPPGVRP
jgi:hypothetical protein